METFEQSKSAFFREKALDANTLDTQEIVSIKISLSGQRSLSFIGS